MTAQSSSHDRDPAASARFSFIIPALNEEACIAECIRAVQAQSDPPFEIIVVDNGSSDRTAEIARGLGCIVVSRAMPGASHARNAGAAMARGDILCFIDADGVIASGWTRAARGCFADPKIGALSGLSVYVHPGLLQRLWYNTYTLVIGGAALLSSLLLDRMIFAANNLAMRRELFVQIGGYEPVIGEGLWLSRRFWAQSKYKGRLCLRMILLNSPRGFEHKGYLRTLLYWIRAAALKSSQSGYTYKSR